LELGFELIFHGNKVDLFSNKKFVGSGFLHDGFFILNSSNENSNTHCLIAERQNEYLWHSRLGHVGELRMKRLAKEGLLGSLRNVSLPTCEYCLAGKMSRKPFGKGSRAQFPLALVHSDICGPLNVISRQGFRYFLTFTDDYTRYTHVYLLKFKGEAISCFLAYVQLVENQLNTTIKCLRTDRGGEYLSNLFKGFCEQKGIERQLTIPNTPQQNGVAERKNHTLLDMVRSMMAQANLDMSYWGDALLTAAYVLNRMPSKSVSSTPYELWTQRKPNLSNLRPWGCATYVHNTKSEFGKLGPKGKKCVFLRYCEHSKGYVFADLEEGSKRAEFDSRDAIFLENEFLRKENVTTGVSFYEMSE